MYIAPVSIQEVCACYTYLYPFLNYCRPSTLVLRWLGTLLSETSTVASSTYLQPLLRYYQYLPCLHALQCSLQFGDRFIVEYLYLLDKKSNTIYSTHHPLSVRYGVLGGIVLDRISLGDVQVTGMATDSDGHSKELENASFTTIYQPRAFCISMISRQSSADSEPALLLNQPYVASFFLQ